MALFFSPVLAADKMPLPKTVKDGKVDVEGTVTSLADIERAAARGRMTASTGMVPAGIVMLVVSIGVEARYGATSRVTYDLIAGLVIAVVGGLLVSQFLTLYTTPAIYLLFARLERRLSRRRRMGRAAPASGVGVRRPQDAEA